MTGSILPPGPLSYEGVTAVQYINKPFPPSANGPNFPVPTIYTDTLNRDSYINVAPNVFIPIGGTPGQLDELTSDSGTAVADANNNINILGTAAQGISTSATASTMTLTIADWTTAQKGVGILSSDAQAIAGTGTTQAVTPHALGAKLGTQTIHGVMLGAGSTAALGVTTAGTTGQVLIGATSADPAFGALGVNSGLTAHGVLLGEANSAIAATAAGTTGQVLTGVTGADPTFQTTPTNASSFRAVKSASTTNATGDATTVTLVCDTPVFDSGSNYNASTGQFTAPTTGKYLIGFNIELGNLGAGHTKAVYSINNTGSGAGSAILNINPFNNASSDGLYTFSWSGYVNLTAADVITITVTVYNSTKTVSIDGNGTGITEFWGVRLT